MSQSRCNLNDDQNGIANIGLDILLDEEFEQNEGKMYCMMQYFSTKASMKALILIHMIVSTSTWWGVHIGKVPASRSSIDVTNAEFKNHK